MTMRFIKTAKLKTGVLLSIKNDTTLKAPKNSLVVYADFFRGYGNMVILDLGNGYHLILSGLISWVLRNVRIVISSLRWDWP